MWLPPFLTFPCCESPLEEICGRGCAPAQILDTFKVKKKMHTSYYPTIQNRMLNIIDYFLYIDCSLKMVFCRAREMAQLLRAIAALLKNLDLIPSTWVRSLPIALTPIPGTPMPSSGPYRHCTQGHVDVDILLTKDLKGKLQSKLSPSWNT